jgi:hypothetical protein
MGKKVIGYWQLLTCLSSLPSLGVEAVLFSVTPVKFTRLESVIPLKTLFS